MDPAKLARSAMEGATMGLAYGLNKFSEMGVNPSEIRATGGGSKSLIWRQIAADVFNTQVYIPVGKLLISILIELLVEL